MARAKQGFKDLNDSMAHGVEGDIRDRMQVELAHQIGAASFRCLDAKAQGCAEFFRGLSFGHPLNHFSFARRQDALRRSVALLVQAQVAIEQSSAPLWE